ncbi:hypothetical protein HNR44_000294 [Geomicrobium halophilum]|uniref:Stage II sporulation protein B n=1 Tax=Geomicrobium halophilum TaxID=549000 RepID=A0A841PWT1_9BACL|nr:hypothetical protein [Geomicrobium halophilum]MBB6448345.1 hypothetical protein [Geomicrobium halophilum]
MGQDHRKMTFKINGKEIESHRDTNAEKENDQGERKRPEVIDLTQERKEWAGREKESVRRPQKESPGLPLNRKKKKTTVTSKKNWSFQPFKIPVLIIAALCVGLLFGLPLLQVTTNFSLTSEEITATFNDPGSGSGAAEDFSSEDQLLLDVVQAGAFETNEAGQEMKETFAEAGFPTLLHDIEEEEMVYLYVGMTPQGQAEEEVIPEINNEGLEGYVKTFSIPTSPEEADPATEELTSDLGASLIKGLTATAPGENGEEAEATMANVNMEALSTMSEDSEKAEELLQALQVLQEEGNESDHEVWMEVTLAYEEWTTTL